MNTLFQPYRLNDTLTLANRFMMAPLTRCMAGPGLVPTEQMAAYYGRRADIGLIISEATIIRPDGQGYPNTPGLYSAEQIAMWLDGRSPQTYREAIVGGNVWLAQNDGIQGFVEVDGHEVSKLFIRGSGARQGIGRLLLEKALQQIRDAGHSRAYLEATLTAEKFYQQFGFRKIGEGTFSRGNSPVSIEIIKMERPLQAT